jgi:hypothetical protein
MSSQQESKKQYIKPEVVKHGSVEELTKVIGLGSSSSPVQPPPITLPSFPFFFTL